MQSASASGCSDATTLMAARVFGPRPQELEATRPRVRARFNKPRNVARSCSGEGGSANIFPRVADLSVDLAPASVHKTIGVLRQVLAMAVRENRLVMNPVDGVRAARGGFGGAAVSDVGTATRACRCGGPPAGVCAGDVWAALREGRRIAVAGSGSSEEADPDRAVCDARG